MPPVNDAGDAERIGEASRSSSRILRRGSRRAEAAAGAGGMPAEVVVRPVAAGAFEHARGNVVAGERSP